MATYPAHIVTFGTHHDGDVVSSADPNTIQAEVFALETILGVNPHVSTTPNPAGTFTATSTSFATVGTRLANIETGIVSDAHSQYAYRSGGTLTNPTINGGTLNAASTIGGVSGTTLAAEQTAWAAFSTSWTADTVNPAIGNGTLACRYKQIGKTVHFEMILLPGSTTSHGSGNWTFTLPAAAASGAGSASVDVICGFGFDQSAGNGFDHARTVLNGSTFQILNANPPGSSRGTGNFTWDSGTPFTWANGDSLKLRFTYEAA